MKTWDDFFAVEKRKPYWKNLESFWDEQFSTKTVFPSRELIFNAFSLTPLEEVKVVIIGQDPYHEKGQAMGLSFSVPDTSKCPPSLNNIFKEIEIEFGRECEKNGDLTYLAHQGVLLINTILTVEEAKPMSHNIKEYSIFSRNLLGFLNNLDQPIVFMLWGGNAQKFEKYLSNSNHLVIKRTHPSPLGANQGGWFNQNTFKICNEFLKNKKLKEVEWCNR